MPDSRPVTRRPIARPVVGHPGEHRLQGHTDAAAGIHDDTGGATLYLASQSAEEDEGAV